MGYGDEAMNGVPDREGRCIHHRAYKNGVGIIRDHPSGRYNATSRYHGTPMAVCMTIWAMMMPSHLLEDSTRLLHLGSHALAFAVSPLSAPL